MRNRSRSSLEALSDTERGNIRVAALTRAQQGLRKPMVEWKDARPGGREPMVEPDDAMFASGRAGHRGEPQAPAGTQNGRSIGTSANDGVELLANVITNRVTRETGQRPNSSPTTPTFPRKGKRARPTTSGGGPLMPRKRS